MYNGDARSLTGRMVSFSSDVSLPAAHIVAENLKRAFSMRSRLFSNSTNAYRMVNGDGDLLPSLVIDRYDDCAVVQSHSIGADRWIDDASFSLVDRLMEFHPFRGILEKSTSHTRREDGLDPRQRWLHGDAGAETVVSENGIPMIVPLEHGQKTGLFLDQREMRAMVSQLAAGKRVLNLCCYTGGFSLAALVGGAERVVSVDSSSSALAVLGRNIPLLPTSENNAIADRHEIVCADIFDYLDLAVKRKELFDMVILDPPAFAKSAKDVRKAVKAYHNANLRALQVLDPSRGGFLVTCSCSYHVDEEAFERAVKAACIDGRKYAQIIGRHRQACDHPQSLYHPEGSYIKGLVLHVHS
jgi:23S rRNA (cytosine1962-C5)-methyltransferase